MALWQNSAAEQIYTAIEGYGNSIVDDVRKNAKNLENQMINEQREHVFSQLSTNSEEYTSLINARDGFLSRTWNNTDWLRAFNSGKRKQKQGHYDIALLQAAMIDCGSKLNEVKRWAWTVANTLGLVELRVPVDGKVGWGTLEWLIKLAKELQVVNAFENGKPTWALIKAIFEKCNAPSSSSSTDNSSFEVSQYEIIWWIIFQQQPDGTKQWTIDGKDVVIDASWKKGTIDGVVFEIDWENVKPELTSYAWENDGWTPTSDWMESMSLKKLAQSTQTIKSVQDWISTNKLWINQQKITLDDQWKITSLTWMTVWNTFPTSLIWLPQSLLASSFSLYAGWTDKAVDLSSYQGKKIYINGKEVAIPSWLNTDLQQKPVLRWSFGLVVQSQLPWLSSYTDYFTGEVAQAMNKVAPYLTFSFLDASNVQQSSFTINSAHKHTIKWWKIQLIPTALEKSNMEDAKIAVAEFFQKTWIGWAQGNYEELAKALLGIWFLAKPKDIIIPESWSNNAYAQSKKKE